MKHVVYGVLTRYLRFLPRTHQGGVCMRTEVFGVKKNPSEFESLMHFFMSTIIMLSSLIFRKVFQIMSKEKLIEKG